MDVIFTCPKCEQELAVDSTGAGSEIDCPSCGETIVIPEAAAVPRSGEGIPTLPPDPSAPGTPQRHASAMASSAAAKVEMHLRVPSNKAPEVLIAKPLAPLEVAAKESDRKMRVKTIKHTDCIEVGHDKFDEFVTNFLIKVGEPNIISINTLTYTHLDIGSQKLMTDFGVMIVYRG
jgi:hypothetical protein